jgi:glucose repression regulatory protein TUP1
MNDPNSLSNVGVISVAISPSGQFVAAGSLDAAVRIWDVATGVLIKRLWGHQDSVTSVVFTRDGNGLVSGSLDNTLKLWNVSGLSAVEKTWDMSSPMTFHTHAHKVHTYLAPVFFT